MARRRNLAHLLTPLAPRLAAAATPRATGPEARPAKRFRHRRQLGPDFTPAGSNPSPGAMSLSKDENGIHLSLYLYTRMLGERDGKISCGASCSEHCFPSMDLAFALFFRE